MAKTKPKPKNTTAIVNRRVRYDYNLGEEIVVGLALDSKHVRAARDNHVQLKGSYVTIRGGELWLNNASWTLKNNEPGKTENTVSTDPIKLLATKKQINGLVQAKLDGNTIVALKLKTGGRLIKLVIAAGEGKKKYDKRETIKRRESDREAARA